MLGRGTSNSDYVADALTSQWMTAHRSQGFRVGLMRQREIDCARSGHAFLEGLAWRDLQETSIAWSLVNQPFHARVANRYAGSFSSRASLRIRDVGGTDAKVSTLHRW